MCLNYWVRIKKKKSAQPNRTQHLNLIQIKKKSDKASVRTYTHSPFMSNQKAARSIARPQKKKVESVET